MRVSIIFAVLFALLFGGCNTPPPDSSGSNDELIAPSGGAARLARDERGVPHIVADDLTTAMYALGFAQAEDRLFQMHVRRLRMQGRLAEFFASEDEVVPGFNARLIDADRRIRTMGVAQSVARLESEMDPEYRRLLASFSAGINAQIAEREVLGTAFAQAGISRVEPWTAADALLGWQAIGEKFGNPWGDAMSEVDKYLDCGDADGCRVPTCAETSIDEEAAIVPQPEDGSWPPTTDGVDDAMASLLPIMNPRPPVDVKASQGFVVAGRHLEGGQPLIFGEPQLTLEAPSVWYESRVEVPSEAINVRGVGFAGSPGMLMHYNRNTSQTITAGGGDMADLFIIEPGRSESTYVLDGRERAYDVRRETIRVRGGDDVSFAVLETEFGPVINDALSNSRKTRVGETRFAMRRVDFVRPGEHSVLAGIELMRSTNLETYRDALRHWTVPTVNALYAGVDAETGEQHIAFHSLLTIPRRTSQTVQGMDATGRYPSNGSTSRSDWRGTLDLNWNPHVIDPESGVLFSGNHLPVGRWYDSVVYTGVRGNGDTFRSYEVRTRLAEILAAGPVNEGVLHELHVDSRSEVLLGLLAAMETVQARDLFPRDVRGTTPTNTVERVARAISLLQIWRSEGGGDLDQRIGVSVFANEVLKQSITAARQEPFACEWAASEGGVTYMLREVGEDPSHLGPVEARFLAATVDMAYAKLGDVYGGMDAVAAVYPSSEAWARFTGGVQPYRMAYQRDFGCLADGPTNANGTPAGSCSYSEDFRLEAIIAQNYINTIGSTQASSWPFTAVIDEDVRAYALLAPGIAEDPRHPHFDDQISAIELKGEGDIAGIPRAPLGIDPRRLAAARILRP